MRLSKLNRLSLFLLGAAMPAALALVAMAQEVKKDVPYVPTPDEVVAKMLELADLKKGEVMYDLGCGDGRIVVTAAKKYGATGTGVDIDPERIKESNENAEKAGVTDQVKFVIQDLFTMDFHDADVVTLYLLTSVNERLKPRLLEQLKPGARVVSHAFSMGDWEPEQEVTVDPGGQTVYFWTIPAKVAGTWQAKVGGQQATLDLEQQYQNVTGTATVGGKKAEVSDAKLKGEVLTLTLNGKQYTARVDGNQLAAVEGQGDQAASITGRREGEPVQAGGKEKGRKSKDPQGAGVDAAETSEPK